MDVPHTPEFEKSKPTRQPTTMPSPLPSPLPEKLEAQKVAVLPPTPKTTPRTGPMADSFDEEHGSDDKQATKMSIESLATGQNQTADFIPPWGATGHESLTNVPQAPTDRLLSTSRCSTPELLAAPTLVVQISNLPAGLADPQEARQPPPQAPSQSRRKAGVRAFNKGKAEMYEKYGRRQIPGGIATIADIQQDARERMEAGQYVGIEQLDPKRLEPCRLPKPTPRSKGAKPSKKSPPAPAEEGHASARRSRSQPRSVVPDLPLSDEDETLSDHESNYSVQYRPAKRKTAGGRPRHSLEEQDETFNGSVQDKRKTNGTKRKSPGNEQESLSHKKRKTGTRGTGEGKPKSKKDKRLEDIKKWLCSYTKKTFPKKEPHNPREALKPDHKSDYKALSFVRLPKMGLKIDTAQLEEDETMTLPPDYHGGDSADLHPKEQRLAQFHKLTYDQYRCQKRRIFAARAVFDRICERENLSPAWGKTQTQLINTIDANKSSFLFMAFEKWGWFETMRDRWDEDYLNKLETSFLAHDPNRSWTPASEETVMDATSETTLSDQASR
jgi:hypothetical protein